jgi:hypothetical protein
MPPDKSVYGCLLGLILNPEEGSSIFLENVIQLLLDYTATDA